MHRRSVLTTMAMLAAMSGAAANAGPLVITNPYEPRLSRALTVLPSPIMRGYKGAGISMAQQKRASKKAKNRARHKLAMKRR